MSRSVVAAWLVAAAVSYMYTFLCPFTKVEESFNIQAVHDHLHHSLNLSQFDHKEFPGVVPRTFIGSIIVGYSTKLLSIPFQGFSKLTLQLIARCILASLVLAAYLHFLMAVKRIFGSAVAVWSCLLLVTQFHFLYYSSRPLPNTFALIFVLFAWSFWLRNQFREFVFFAGWTIIVFRCELAILFGPMLLITLIYANVSYFRLLLWILTTGILSLGSTVLIDSFFWGRWLWPEGEAFYFNAVLNKSSEWGTSPFLWYFYSALPRAMGLSLLFAPFGMAIDKRCLMMSLPAFCFVLLYSLLPHKELRFIIYVVPILNIPAARLCSVIWNNKSKGLSRRFAALVVLGHMAFNICMTGFLLKVSYHNYPGGHALHFLNNQVHPAKAVNVHIDVYSAQTGVTRFLHEHPNWRYDKTEDSKVYGARIDTYTHLLLGTPDEPAIKPLISVYSQTHNIIHKEMCFKNIQLLKSYPYIDIRLAPCVWLLELKLSAS